MAAVGLADEVVAVHIAVRTDAASRPIGEIDCGVIDTAALSWTGKGVVADDDVVVKEITE